MKLSSESIIDDRKIKDYLLQERKRNDKSKWLIKAGYNLDDWKKLENDLRIQILTLDAIPIDKTKYGKMYEIKGVLKGPNGRTLFVHSIWMKESETNSTKFITMFPDHHKGMKEKK